MTDTSTIIRPLNRATLPQEIVKALTDLIMNRVWKPGDLIPSEKELAIRFQVGRSTIREAVKSLVVLGVLEARAGEGSFVREATSELLSGAFRWGLLLGERNLDHLVDVRVLVEVECTRRAARHHSRELAEELFGSIREMQTRQADDNAFKESDTSFHLTISRAAQNPIFENIGSTIQSMVRIWYPKTYYIPETKGRTIAEHTAIAEAIASGKEADARGCDAATSGQCRQALCGWCCRNLRAQNNDLCRIADIFICISRAERQPRTGTEAPLDQSRRTVRCCLGVLRTISRALAISPTP